MNIKKLTFTIIIFINIFLAGCSGGREINTLGIAIAVGIDKSINGYLLTYQFLNNKAIASKKPSNESAFFLYTEEGEDLFELIRRITTKSPRRIYSSHVRTVVFSEDIAKEGIQKVMDIFMRDHEFRTDFYFIVAKDTTANEILKVLTPLEPVSGIEIYNSLQTSEKAWAPIVSTKVVKLANNLLSDGINPVLTGIEIIEHGEKSNNINILTNSDSNKLKLNNLCAFKKDKLIGWLTQEESIGYNYIIGNVKDTIEYVQYDEENKVTFEVISAKSKIKAYMSDGNPAIKVEIKLIANIAAITGKLDITDNTIIEKLNKMLETRITQICNNSIKRASKDLGTDIFGFGEAIHRSYPKVWNSLKENWNDHFVSLPANVKVTVNLNGLGESTRSIF